MSVVLYDHQLDAIRRMHNGCILYGGVGSGKSLTAIGYYYMLNGGAWESLTGQGNYMPMDDPPMDLYIITTARKRDMGEWSNELGKFLLNTEKSVNLYRNSVIVDSWNNIQKYADVKGAFFLFDEQRVIGSGKWVRAFLKIAKANQWILLSATPGDSWKDYIPVFVANGFYKNRSEFMQKHVIFSRYAKYPKIDRYWNTKRLSYFRDKVLVPMNFERNTVSHHETVWVEYDKILYHDIQKRRWNPWKDKPLENASEFCNALRRVVNSDESRQAAILEIYEDHPRMIVFYNYNYELDILRGMNFDGAVVTEWNGMVHEDIPDGPNWVYLVQFSACEGWNCIKTDTVVFYSLNPSYRVTVQAQGRIDRLNTPYRDLYYYQLRSGASIDSATAKALSEKRDFNEQQFANF